MVFFILAVAAWGSFPASADLRYHLSLGFQYKQYAASSLLSEGLTTMAGAGDLFRVNESQQQMVQNHCCLQFSFILKLMLNRSWYSLQLPVTRLTVQLPRSAQQWKPQLL